MVDKDGVPKRPVADGSNSGKTLKRIMSDRSALNSLFNKEDTTTSYPTETHQNYRMMILHHLKLHYHPSLTPVTTGMDVKDGYANLMTRPEDWHLQGFRFHKTVVFFLTNIQGISSAGRAFNKVTACVIAAMHAYAPEELLLRVHRKFLPKLTIVMYEPAI